MGPCLECCVKLVCCQLTTLIGLGSAAVAFTDGVRVLRRGKAAEAKGGLDVRHRGRAVQLAASHELPSLRPKRPDAQHLSFSPAVVQRQIQALLSVLLALPRATPPETPPSPIPPTRYS